MKPLYTHCPHCGFPVVVRGCERLLVRHCRQCRGRYLPEEKPVGETPVKAEVAAPRRRRSLARHTVLQSRRR